MARYLDDWILSYLEYVDQTEPPLSFHIWTALLVISSALERKVWTEIGAGIIHPNQYCVLVGPPASRKSTALNLGKAFLGKDGLGFEFLPNATTKEQLAKDLAEARGRDFTDPATGDYHEQRPAVEFASEFINFAGHKEKNDLFLSWLCDLYDQADWNYKIRMEGGSSRIKGTCLNILGAIPEDKIHSVFSLDSIGTGIGSRIVFISEREIRNIRPKKIKWDLSLRDKLLHDLEPIHVMIGEMSWTPEAEDAYCTWYETFMGRIKREKVYPIADPNFHHYCGRRQTHAVKIAMAICASRGDDLTISLKDFKRAVGTLEGAEEKMPRVFRGMGDEKHSQYIEKIRGMIESHGSILKSKILQTYHMHLDSIVLEKIVTTLEKAKLISVSVGDGDSTYTYKGGSDG